MIMIMIIIPLSSKLPVALVVGRKRMIKFIKCVREQLVEAASLVLLLLLG